MFVMLCEKQSAAAGTQAKNGQCKTKHRMSVGSKQAGEAECEQQQQL
jgi:hypothetical protein